MQEEGRKQKPGRKGVRKKKSDLGAQTRLLDEREGIPVKPRVTERHRSLGRKQKREGMLPLAQKKKLMLMERPLEAKRNRMENERSRFGGQARLLVLLEKVLS